MRKKLTKYINRQKVDNYKFKIFISVIVSLIFLQACNLKQKPKEITFQQFENEIMKNHDAEKVNVINKKTAEIYIKNDRLNKPQYRNLPKQGPQFYFKIGSIESFVESMDQAQTNLSEKDLLTISYESTANPIPEIISWVIPILLILLMIGLIILWVVLLIEILKSDFKSPMDKLLWALILILIPVLGIILYLVLGRNQKNKNAP